MEEEKLKKEEMKEPIKPIVLVPEVDREGHAIFRCINKEDAELVATALSSKGVKVKSAKENTCPLEPDKPYAESVCKKIADLFEKNTKCKECEEEN